jgi:hypothetical protein
VALAESLAVRDARRHNLNHERGVQHVALDETAAVSAEPRVDFVVRDDALNALARVDPEKSRPSRCASSVA